MFGPKESHLERLTSDPSLLGAILGLELCMPVACLIIDCNCVLERANGIVELPHSRKSQTEVVQRHGLSVTITCL
jgi:hypothetical protein